MVLLLSSPEASLCVRRIGLLTPLRMSSGVEEILLMAGPWLESKTNLMDQLIASN